MGQLLSHPIEEKSIDYRQFEGLTFAVGSMQGYRMTMEDAHNIKVNEEGSVAVAGVFDGHGGRLCADLASNSLCSDVFKGVNSMHQMKEDTLAKVISIIRNSFFKVDSELPTMEATNCGTTAVVSTIIKNQYIVVANTGDSRCILSLKGGYAKTLSFDHKPSIIGERLRIENSGGFVLNDRVNEILALSRAMGDFKFKNPYATRRHRQKKGSPNSKYKVLLPAELYTITAEPDMLVYDLATQDYPEFMVLACDGIWDCFTNTQLVTMIRQKLVLGWKLTEVIEFVLNECIGMASTVTGIGFDNMTLVVIALHQDETIEEWYKTMKAS